METIGFPIMLGMLYWIMRNEITERLSLCQQKYSGTTHMKEGKVYVGKQIFYYL